MMKKTEYSNNTEIRFSNHSERIYALIRKRKIGEMELPDVIKTIFHAILVSCIPTYQNEVLFFYLEFFYEKDFESYPKSLY